MRMLGYSWVQIVLNHQHYGCCLTRAVRIVVYGTGVHVVVRTEAVHIYTAIIAKLLCKLGCKHGVELAWEISQRVPQSQFLLLIGQYVLASGRMVYIVVIRFHFWQNVGNARTYLCRKLFVRHHVIVFILVTPCSLPSPIFPARQPLP